MDSGLRPQDERHVAEAVAWAASGNNSLTILGRGTKRSVGRPVDSEYSLDLSALDGITLYEPEELVLGAHAGTAMKTITEALEKNRQQLAFEPADLSALLGARPRGAGSIGGILAANLSGPRRIRAGAARDFFLGVRAVSGRGELFKSGGRVVKNVTGYDMCKGLAGSWGTLAVLTHVTIKVMPAPETSVSLIVGGLDDEAAVALMCEVIRTVHEVSAAAHVQQPLTGRSKVAQVSALEAAATVFRLEGVGPSVRHGTKKLEARLRKAGALETLASRASLKLWREIRDVHFLARPGDRLVWKLSVPPACGAAVVGEISSALADTQALFDWAGGLVWLSVPRDPSAHAGVIRKAVAATGGHATLFRAPANMRSALEVFPPLAPGADLLARRLKSGFDPNNILNFGRMYAGM